MQYVIYYMTSCKDWRLLFRCNMSFITWHLVKIEDCYLAAICNLLRDVLQRLKIATSWQYVIYYMTSCNTDLCHFQNCHALSNLIFPRAGTGAGRIWGVRGRRGGGLRIQHLHRVSLQKVNDFQYCERDDVMISTAVWDSTTDTDKRKQYSNRKRVSLRYNWWRYCVVSGRQLRKKIASESVTVNIGAVGWTPPVIPPSPCAHSDAFHPAAKHFSAR